MSDICLHSTTRQLQIAMGAGHCPGVVYWLRDQSLLKFYGQGGPEEKVGLYYIILETEEHF